MRWLIVEPLFDGHHYSYLEQIISGAKERAIDVVVGIADDAQGQMTQKALVERFGPDGVRLVVSPPPRPCRLSAGFFGFACSELRRRHFLKETYRKAEQLCSIDFVFLPYFDWALYAIALVGTPFADTPFAGITMGQRFHFDAVGVEAARDGLARLKEIAFQRLVRIRSLTRIFTIDETLAAYFGRRKEMASQKVVFVPDPSDVRSQPSRGEARKRLNVGDDTCAVLAYGFLDARKAIARLLDWVSSERAPRTTVLMAVGKQSEEVAALFQTDRARQMESEGRLHINRKFVTDEEEALYFRAADVVWLGYDRFDFMSGVLVRAAQYASTVVFEPRGLIAYYANKYGGEAPNDHSCHGLFENLPVDLSVKSFADAGKREGLPDHSWANALRLIYG